jgi:hypothetical protein
MVQLDGAAESKPAAAEPPIKPSSRASTAKERCTHVFRGARKRTKSGLSNLSGPEGQEDNEAPMRIISPRATTLEPAPALDRTRTFSFKKRHSNMSTKSKNSDNLALALPSPTSPAKNNQSVVQASVSGDHVPATQVPYESPARRQSVAMGALTSHPIVKGDNGRRESGEEKYDAPLGMLDGVSPQKSMP